MAKYELAVEAEFSAAHQIPGHPGACARLHGHNYRVVARFLGQKLDSMGMVADFGELKSLLRDIVGRLDHRNLNELPVLEGGPPTSERIAEVIYRDLAKLTADRTDWRDAGLRVASVTVWESAGASVTYSEDEA